VIGDITVTGSTFDNNYTEGVAADGSTHLGCVALGSSNLYFGSNQTTTVDSNIQTAQAACAPGPIALGTVIAPNGVTLVGTGGILNSPNNTCFAWIPSGSGSPVCAVGVSAVNVSYLTPVTSGGEACLNNFAGVALFCGLGATSAGFAIHEEDEGTAPVLTSGWGSGASISGNDNVGTITIGTGMSSTAVMTFHTAWGQTPVCSTHLVSSGVGGAASIFTTTTTTFTYGAALTAGATLQYSCRGWQ
jgi:hypothetical protein